MTYAALGSFGAVGLGAEGDDVGSCPWAWQAPEADFCAFSRKSWQPGEVYVMRLTVDGVPGLDTATKAMAWAEAYGDSSTSWTMPDQEIKGVVVRPHGDAPGVWKIEIVLTVPTSTTFVTTPPPPEGAYIQGLEASPVLRQRWPNFRVTGFQSLQLLRPPGQINDWRAASSIWSAELKGETGSGTTAAGSMSQNTWNGGTAAHPQARFPTPEPPDIGPPNGKGEAKKTGLGAWLWLGIGTAVVGAIYLGSRRKKS